MKDKRGGKKRSTEKEMEREVAVEKLRHYSEGGARSRTKELKIENENEKEMESSD